MLCQDLTGLFPRLFEPKSVAFIGATDMPGKWGFTILSHVARGEYHGRLHLVNPNRPTVFGQPTVPRMADIPETPDLAILVVPAQHALSALKDVIEKGTKAAVVITSGFAEAGAEGRALQDRLVAMARDAGLYFVGPNSMGITTAFPDRLCSTMASIIPPPGRVAVAAQSGNLGTTLITRLMRRSIGISRSISTGNQASLTLADYVDMLADDPHTDILCLYMEGAPNGRRFLEAAEYAARKKPVLLLKGARGGAASKAAISHTAALSGSHDVYAAAVQEAGVILTETMDELINLVGAFHSNPVPKGNRAGILTLGGGWGVLAADGCERYGISVPDLPEPMVKELNAMLPEYWSKGNPIDTVATTDITTIPRTLTMLMNSDDFDGVIYLGVGFLAYQGRRYLDKGPGYRPDFEALGNLLIHAEANMVRDLLELRRRTNKPLFLVADLAARDEQFDENIVRFFESNGIFVHNSPWEPTHAFSHLVRYGRWREESLSALSQPPVEMPVSPADLEEGRRLIARTASRPGRQLSEGESKRLLRLAGVPVPEEEIVSTAEEAVRAAERIGTPVALKTAAPEILHKTEAGGVILNLSAPEAVRAAAEKLLPMGPVSVQRMAAPPRAELLVGLKHDFTFGMVVVFGKGGIDTEVWQDVAMLPAPVTVEKARRLIARTRVSRLLGAFRGKPALDVEELARLVARVSRLPEFFPELAELDINPLFIGESGLVAVDAAAVVG